MILGREHFSSRNQDIRRREPFPAVPFPFHPGTTSIPLADRYPYLPNCESIVPDNCRVTCEAVFPSSIPYPSIRGNTSGSKGSSRNLAPRQTRKFNAGFYRSFDRRRLMAGMESRHYVAKIPSSTCLSSDDYESAGQRLSKWPKTGLRVPIIMQISRLSGINRAAARLAQKAGRIPRVFGPIIARIIRELQDGREPRSNFNRIPDYSLGKANRAREDLQR